MEILQKKNNKKLFFIILGLILAIATITAVVITTSSNSPKNRLKRLLNEGNKYLSELNIESAIASFSKAIEIDPHNVNAYLGLADAYCAQADEYISLAQYSDAASAYSKAISILNDYTKINGENSDISSKLIVIESLANDLTNYGYLSDSALISDELSSNTASNEDSSEYELGPELVAEEIAFFEDIWSYMENSEYEKLHHYLVDNRELLFSVVYNKIISAEFRDDDISDHVNLRYGYEQISYGYIDNQLIACQDVTVPQILLIDYIDYTDNSFTVAIYLGGLSNNIPEGDAHRYKNEYWAPSDTHPQLDAYAYINTTFREGNVDGDFVFEDICNYDNINYRKIIGHADNGVLNGECTFYENNEYPIDDSNSLIITKSCGEINYSYSDGKVILDDNWSLNGDDYEGGTAHYEYSDGRSRDFENHLLSREAAENMLDKMGIIGWARNGLLGGGCGLFA